MKWKKKPSIPHPSHSFLILRGLSDGGKKGNISFARHPSCSFFKSRIDPTALAKLKANPIKEKGIRNGGEGVFEAQ